MAVKKFDLVLESSSMITPRVRELAFVRGDGEPLDFEPGQFVSLMIQTPEKLLRRSYSIATIPGTGDDHCRLAVAHVEGGRATKVLFELEQGESLPAIGPAGRFVLRDDGHCRYVLMATGTGVTPYRSFLPELRERLTDPKVEVDLLLGVRNPEELLYGEDFRQMDEEFDNFRFHASYSRELPDAPGPRDHKGYVQEQLPELGLDPSHDVVYLCGNPGMIDAAAKFCEEKEFPIANVRREKYVSSN
ncbi:MAG: FAD-binding oxidoreductase [Gammaproteobacteria bacterium]|nr:FAD-binding oxidoreductase [Gammaproteobacteria bacterium]